MCLLGTDPLARVTLKRVGEGKVSVQAAPLQSREATIASVAASGRNIVIFSDGTGQDGGIRPEQRLSNVYKLYRAAKVGPDTDIDPANQLAFYDPGLGTDTSAKGVTGIDHAVTKFLSAATGRGITLNIADCYEFIINHYRPGDRIFLFGFSRGAYTARSLANVLWLCGVPTKVPEGELPRFRQGVREIADEAVVRVYEHGAGHPRAEFESERFELARRFRAKYGSGDEEQSNAAPYFIGVFDTVASLGAKGPLKWFLRLALAGSTVAAIAILSGLLHEAIGLSWRWAAGVSAGVAVVYVAWRYLRSALKVIWKPPQGGWFHMHLAQWSDKNFDRLLTKSVAYARHAISIDENRADFPRVPWGWGGGYRPAKQESEPEPLVQLWFAGNHSDIGGSYPETQSRLSDITLKWMIEEATSVPHPLIVDMSKLTLHPEPDGLQHDEVANMSDTIHKRTPALLRWLTRHWTWPVSAREPPVASPTVHPSVAQRFALPEVQQQGQLRPYRPEAMRNHEAFKRYYQ
jgi:uncharacterized protein (DUF2235 family)